jgi:hypothetical protein
MQQCVHRGGRAPLQSITPMSGQCVPKRASGQERNRTKRDQGEFETEKTHDRKHDHYLKHSPDSLLDAVDQYALNRSHVFKQPGHEIAGRAIVEPFERQQLNVRIKIAPKIEDHPLLKSVV